MSNAKKKPQPVPTLDEARAQVILWKDETNQAMPERAPMIDALVTCAIARTNVILYGPPGTAKSLLARAFADAITGDVFDVLMTRYTAPGELLGPVDVQAMKAGSMKRVTNGYLPEAHVAFLDEGFKANSACLNALLTAVNEHAYHDDGQLKPIPLRVAVLASNEFPSENDNLSAFDDRFPMRFDVRPLQNPDSFRDMLSGALPEVTAKIDPLSLDVLQQHSNTVKVGDDTIDALWGLREKLAELGIYASDRKLATCCALLRAQAAVAGYEKVTTAHLGLLENVLWLRPDQKNKVKELVRDHVASWLRDLRAAIDVVDEQEAAMAQAVRGKGNISATGSAIAKVGQKLKELDKDVLKEMESIDEAKSDVMRLRNRVNKILETGRESMTRLFDADSK